MEPGGVSLSIVKGPIRSVKNQTKRNRDFLEGKVIFHYILLVVAAGIEPATSSM